MRKSYRCLAAWMLILLTIMACSVSFGGEEEDEGAAIETAIAETLTAEADTGDDGEEPDIEPTLTLAPTDTEEGEPTEVPLPCNDADFVSETIEDGTEFETGESFTKTWRLKNTGTCTWNTGYKLVFVEGDKMGGPGSQNLTQLVAPGEQVDITVDLEAPGSAGTYKGTWQVQDDDGQAFVYNIWVEIEAVEPSEEAAIPQLHLPAIVFSILAKPDLTITEFSINPPTPVQGENVHVRVRAYNAGTVDSGGFKMEWYGLSTAANPSCSWNINGGLVVDGSVLLECDYSFASWYPVNKTSIVYIDTEDAVDEYDESNNSASISPFGVTQAP